MFYVCKNCAHITERMLEPKDCDNCQHSCGFELAWSAAEAHEVSEDIQAYNDEAVYMYWEDWRLN